MPKKTLKFNDLSAALCKMEGGAKKALNAAQAKEVLKCVCILLKQETSVENAAAVLDFIDRHGD